MPSWNIHIAHAEGLLAESGPLSRAVRDRNAFLFGNLIPDIYVGYMVPGVVHPIPYRITHFAKPEHIPKPREDEFWVRHVAPMASEFGISCEYGGDNGGFAGGAVDVAGAAGTAGAPAAVDAAGTVLDASASRPHTDIGSLAREVEHVSPAHAPTYELAFDPVHSARFQEEAFEEAAGESIEPPDARRPLFDMVLGVWVHLLADTMWNQRVSDYLDVLGEKPSKDFRIKKQSDFDQFGKSLSIDSFPVVTPQLVDTAAQFPQYAIDERSVIAASAIAHEIVRTNYLTVPASYRLLTAEFFAATFAEVQRSAARLMRERL